MLMNKLKVIKKENKGTLKYAVCKYVLDYYSSDEEIKGFFNDLNKHGCVSGMVNNLIYYTDTIKFYKKYQDDIEQMLSDFGGDVGAKSRAEAIIQLNGNAENLEREQNLLAWFGFEETAQKISEELGLSE